MADKKSESKKEKPSLKKVIWFSIAASVLLLLSNSAIWVNNQIFNTDNFTHSVTTSLTSESSRLAISQQITDKMFADRPVAKRIAGDFSVKIISGLLDTDQFEKVLTTAVERMQIYVTSNNQETVDIDLRGVKDIITKLTNVSESLGREPSVDPANIPDQIVLINEENVPDFYNVGVAFLWIAPITFIAAILLLAYPYVKRGYNNKKVLVIQSLSVISFGLLALLIGPLFKPPLLANIKEANGRIVVGNIYDTFIATFNTQTLLMFIAGVVALLVALGWYSYPTVKQLLMSKKKSEKTSK